MLTVRNVVGVGEAGGVWKLSYFPLGFSDHLMYMENL